MISLKLRTIYFNASMLTTIKTIALIGNCIIGCKMIVPELLNGLEKDRSRFAIFLAVSRIF